MGYALILLVIGGVSLLHPRFWWQISRWQYRHPEANEPSEAAFMMSRLSGGLMVAVSVGVIVVAVQNDNATARSVSIRERQGADPIAFFEEFLAEVPLDATTRLPHRSTMLPIARRHQIEVAPFGTEFTVLRQLPARLDDGEDRLGASLEPYRYCLSFPEQGPPAVQEQGCPYSEEGVQSARSFFHAVVDAAAARRLSPRDPALLAEIDKGDYAVTAVPSPTFASDGRATLTIESLNNHEDRCITLPAAPLTGRYPSRVSPGRC